MAVTIKDVEYVAGLARLEFTNAEKDKLTLQLNKILEYMEKLNELDTTGVEPLSHVIEASSVGGGMLREDKVAPSYPVEDMLANAPDRRDTFFRVPKVIGDR